MKRFIALLMSIVMVLGVTACGNAAGTENQEQKTGEETAAEETDSSSAGGTSVDSDGTVITNYQASDVKADKETEKYNILVLYRTFTDKLGSQYKASLEYLAEGMNVEFTFLETGNNDEEAKAAYEAALINKPDAIISSKAYAYWVDMAGDIPIVICGAIPPEEELEDIVSHENYLGNIAVNDYEAGYAAATRLYEDGARSVLLCGVTQGISGQHDARAKGFLDGVASYEDMNLLGEDYTMALFTDSISSYAASYPELDGVFCSAMLESIYSTFETEGLVGQAKLSGVDVTESVGEYFENGTLSYIAGGNYVTPMLGFLVLYNYLTDGTRLIEDPAVTVQWNNIDIGSIDDFNEYIEYLDSGIPAYTAEEMMEMVHYFNEDFTAEDFLAAGKAFTLEDVKARHADLME